MGVGVEAFGVMRAERLSAADEELRCAFALSRPPLAVWRANRGEVERPVRPDGRVGSGEGERFPPPGGEGARDLLFWAAAELVGGATRLPARANRKPVEAYLAAGFGELAPAPVVRYFESRAQNPRYVKLCALLKELLR